MCIANLESLLDQEVTKLKCMEIWRFQWAIKYS